MNCYIKEIIILGKDKTSRKVRLSKGLNIITGHSKKGKSALIEIVDYCMCAPIPSIPLGAISDYAETYCIVLKSKENYLVIGRTADTTDKTIYVAIESNINAIKNIDHDYFESKNSIKIKGGGQELIEQYLGFNVKNIFLPEKNNKARKASLRSMTPFWFQYQNLVASKHALFSKLDDFYKRKDIIEQLPILLGVTDAEYFSLKRQEDELINKLKQIEKAKAKELLFNREYENKLNDLYCNYFSQVGAEYNKPSNFSSLISLSKNLPPLSHNYYMRSDSIRLYKDLQIKESELSIELNNINSEIKNAEETVNLISESNKNFITLKSINTGHTIHDCSCPICGTELLDINAQAIELESALSELDTEISTMKNFTSFDVEQIELLKTNKRKAQSEIRSIKKQLKELEGFKEKVKKYQSKNTAIQYLAAKIDVAIEQISNTTSSTDYGENELKDELKDIQSKLSKYDFSRDIYLYENKVKVWMDEICNNLDFEKQFLPANLSMKFDELSIIHQDTKFGKVRLSDMGSGANWLAFHLSASLAMLRIINYCKKSCIPAFLFIDQPSQVYFPTSFDENDLDRKKVENIYFQILNSLKASKSESGYYSQVIVLDHATDLNLGKYKFKRYLRKQWRDENSALI